MNMRMRRKLVNGCSRNARLSAIDAIFKKALRIAWPEIAKSMKRLSKARKLQNAEKHRGL
jgi:hypothetical protein